MEYPENSCCESAPEPAPPVIRAPRISGLAMPNNVFLSTGNVVSAPTWKIMFAGLALLFVGAISTVPTFITAWLIEQVLPTSIPAVYLGFASPTDPMLAAIVSAGMNFVAFFMFLFVLRLTPIAGYHAAEHMTVHAIEHWGLENWEEHVKDMPRAHKRCGTVLISGILPALLIGFPLLGSIPLLAIPFIVAGWMTRMKVGFFIQNNFTTRPPSALQLQRGIDAGRRVLERWKTTAPRKMSTWEVLYMRGLPQMLVATVLFGIIINQIYNWLPQWLDW